MKYIKLHIKFVIVHLLCFSNSKKRKKRFANQYEYDAGEKKERERESETGGKVDDISMDRQERGERGEIEKRKGRIIPRGGRS